MFRRSNNNNNNNISVTTFKRSGSTIRTTTTKVHVWAGGFTNCGIFGIAATLSHDYVIPQHR